MLQSSEYFRFSFQPWTHTDTNKQSLQLRSKLLRIKFMWDIHWRALSLAKSLRTRLADVLMLRNDVLLVGNIAQYDLDSSVLQAKATCFLGVITLAVSFERCTLKVSSSLVRETSLTLQQNKLMQSRKFRCPYKTERGKLHQQLENTSAVFVLFF